MAAIAPDTRASSSITMVLARCPAPMPPYWRGMVTPIHPCRAIKAEVSTSTAWVDSIQATRGATSESAKARTASRRCWWSSVSNTGHHPLSTWDHCRTVQARQRSSPRPVTRRSDIRRFVTGAAAAAGAGSLGEHVHECVAVPFDQDEGGLTGVPGQRLGADDAHG